MPSITQYQLMPYQDIAETVFYGGWAIQPDTDERFETSAFGYTLVWGGEGFTYDPDNRLTGGTIDSLRIYLGAVEFANLQVDITSNFTLLTAAELADAFVLFADGKASEAYAAITASWTAEYFSHRNYPGGPLFGYGGGDGLIGGVAADYAFGRGGDDLIILNSGYDVGHGGAGNDNIYGGNGNDVLFGDGGNDVLYGDDDADKMYGGIGNDRLYGGKGNDVMAGDAGNDWLDGDKGNDTARGGDGDDSLLGRGGADRLFGQAGNDTLDGHDRDDLLVGGRGDDTLNGGNGNDTLDAGSGDDFLSGNAGQDRLISGAGTDILVGGGDTDTFVIRDFSGSGQRVRDFAAGTDLLDLSAFGFADATVALNSATDTVAGHLRFDLGEGQVLILHNVTATAIVDDILV